MTGFATIVSPDASPTRVTEVAESLARLVVILGSMFIAILSIVMLFAFWAIAIGLGDLLIRWPRKARDLIARTASDLPLSSTIRTIS
ncbi:hypothetical protein [Sphingomonas sp. GB1N7]|uniref:hypothetical protein n=1 Tax=Parasphingomonas caseinilytica TaxID=3096158 RepID=UPI002FC99368